MKLWIFGSRKSSWVQFSQVVDHTPKGLHEIIASSDSLQIVTTTFKDHNPLYSLTLFKVFESAKDGVVSGKLDILYCKFDSPCDSISLELKSRTCALDPSLIEL